MYDVDDGALDSMTVIRLGSTQQFTESTVLTLGDWYQNPAPGLFPVSMKYKFDQQSTD